MTDAEYDDIDAPQHADLSAAALDAGVMSPGTAAWFPVHARESVAFAEAPPTPQAASETPPPPPPPPPPAEPSPPTAPVEATPKVEVAPTPATAVRKPPAVASKPTKASQGWAAPAPKPKGTPASEAKAQFKVAQTKPVAPRLGTSMRLGATPPVASTEELQMQTIAREIRANKQQRDKWREQLDHVLAKAGTKLPARSTAQLTIPVEFELSRSRSAPSSPRNSIGSDGKPLSSPSSKTFGEQVHDFTKTPKRFRGQGAPTEQKTPTSASSIGSAQRTPTAAKAPDLRSSARAAARPSNVKSQDMLDAELMESMPAFKARPVSKAVLESAGDLGVPRVKKCAPTQPKEFLLSTSYRRAAKGDDDAASDAGSTASAPVGGKVFRARPLNKKVMDGRAHGLAQVTPRKPTKPISPKLSTSMRAATRPEPPPSDDEEIALFSSFKARPMPRMSPAPSPIKSPAVRRPVTTPSPFALDSVARREMAETARQRAEQDRAAREGKARLFKARPMPVSESGWRPTVDGKHTKPDSFDLRTDARSEVHQDVLRQRTEEMIADVKRATKFIAKPARVLVKPAFAPRKSTKPLTEITETNVPFSKSAERQERRKELEEQMVVKRAQMAVEAEQKAKRDAVAAAKEIAALRASMVPKARMIPKAAPFVVKKSAELAESARQITQAMAPNLNTADRSALRIIQAS